jgi:hypothetical protein
MRTAFVLLIVLMSVDNFSYYVIGGRSGMTIRSSSLYKDLNADLRDSMYCAMTYLKRCGGPPIIGPLDDLANLRANRQLMLEWLIEQQDKDKIVREYAKYKKLWSPVFLD